MTTLDDQFLSGKSAGYCSSSSDEEEVDNEDRVGPEVKNEVRPNSGSYNTGPKGVIEDWRRFKQLQTERRLEQEKELLNLTKKLSMSCRSHLEDEKAKAKETEDELLKDLDEDDDFIKEYIKRRMNELAANFVQKSNHKFGQVFELTDVDTFLNAVEQDSKHSTVVVHLYENRSKALPTIQAYRDGQLIGNFVRINDEFNEEFYADDVESFLKQYGILPDSTNDGSVLSKKLNDFASSSNTKQAESEED